MSNLLEYNGYHAQIEVDVEDHIFVGTVIGIQDSLSFHGRTLDELEEMFKQSIDNYLEVCKKMNKEPDKEYKGSFNVRIDPSLHRQIDIEAHQEKISLNALIEKILREHFENVCA
ncbi:MAG: type II toxin-antitoxin system HicB family antitoxin [Clostridia bacterium]|nr:type II toxin-antitoxin system HicB family antitoxin [Clostridia bacterium]